MGRQLAPDDPLFAGAARIRPATVSTWICTRAQRSTRFRPAARAARPGRRPRPDGPRDPKCQRRAAASTSFSTSRCVAPTKTSATRADRRDAASARVASDDPTAEVRSKTWVSTSATWRVSTNLGREVDDLLDRTAGAASRTPWSARLAPATPAPEEDLLSSTSIMGADDDRGDESASPSRGVIDLSDATGELPTIEAGKLEATGIMKAPDFGLEGEAATMSEVGTKLDLARAYIDMGDPEGARSILDEVLKEGSAVQRRRPSGCSPACPDGRRDGRGSRSVSSTTARPTPAGSSRRTRASVQGELERALGRRGRPRGEPHGGRSHRCRRARADAGGPLRYRRRPARARLGARRHGRVGGRRHRPLGARRSRTTSTRATPRCRAPTSTASSTGRMRPALDRSRVCWVRRPLDAAAMHAAAQQLLGERDFSSFRAAECQSSTPMRRLLEAAVERHGEIVEITVRANAFLHHMVRNIAGSLILVGAGERPRGLARRGARGARPHAWPGRPRRRRDCILPASNTRPSSACRARPQRFR